MDEIYENLSLENDVFEQMKQDFDAILNKTVADMENKYTEDAAITLKLFITAYRQQETDEEGNTFENVYPSFKYDISSVMQDKTKIAGAVSGEYIYAFDEDECKYVLQKITDPQMTIEEITEEQYSTENDDEYYIYNDEAPVNIDDIFEDDEETTVSYDYDEEDEE